MTRLGAAATPAYPPRTPPTPASRRHPGEFTELLLDAFVHAPSGIAVISADGRYLHVNPATERMLGRTADELLRLHWQDVIHPDDLLPGEEAIERALTEMGLDEEFRALRPDGREVWVRVTASAAAGDPRRRDRLVLHYEDVTARRAGERQAALLAAVAASASDALVTTGRDGRVVFLNEAAERLYGTRAADVVGHDPIDVLVHPEAQGDLRAWRDAMRAGQPQPGPMLLKHRRGDGTTFDAEVTLSPVRDADGRLLGTASVVRDVTSRLAQEEGAATLRAVVDAAVEAIIGVDERDIVRFFSPSAERIFGWRSEEVVGRPAWTLVAEDRQLAARDLRADLIAGRSVRRETVARRKGGSRVMVELTASPIVGPDGGYQGAAITLLDLSDRARAEREAQHSRQLLQRVVDHAPNVIWFKDRDGRCRLANRPGAQMVGLEPEELLGRTDFEVFPRDLAERNRAEDQQVIESGSPMTVAKEFPHAGGGLRPYVVTKFPILDPDGEPDGVGMVASDISEIRRGEADRAHLAALVQAAPDAIVTKDPEGRIATWNPGAERMFGLTADEAVGLPYEVFLPESERDLYWELRDRVEGGETLTIRMDGRRADDTVFPTEVSAAPLKAADGSGGGIVAIIRDISELIEAELELRERAAQLERSNADLERFAYAASHDLQEPLRSIALAAGAVQRSAAERLDEDERELLAHVGEAADRMSAQVSALMEVGRVSLGQDAGEQAPMELALEDALNALRAAIDEVDAQIEVEAPLPTPAVPRAEMAIVLQNLLANAIKFRRDDRRPHVTVSGRMDDGCVVIRVADDGIGLSEANRAHLFGVFGRARPGVPGMGMGLAVCRRIVERRGGSISADSEGQDRGSQFTLRLPVAEAGPSPVSEP